MVTWKNRATDRDTEKRKKKRATQIYRQRRGREMGRDK